MPVGTIKSWMIYGANGFSGALIAREAVRRGLRPVLAGRNREAVASLATDLKSEFRVFDLLAGQRLQAELADIDLVLHCAGPFSATSAPMMDACLATATHYLDITGEIAVFEAAQARDEAARKADVVLCPGAGFDVVPSDCLAASLVEKLPAATRLMLAFEASGGPSPGTAKTGVEGLASGGRVRADGEIRSVPLAYKTRTIPFAHGTRHAVTIPWGDVATAWVSTGVPNIEVYMATPPAVARRLRRLRWVRPLLALGPVQRFLKRRIESTVQGPDAAQRSASFSQFWGEVVTADGRSLSGTLSGPNGYDLTVWSSLAIVEALLIREVEGGYYTPSLLMGADFITRLPGVEMNIQS